MFVNAWSNEWGKIAIRFLYLKVFININIIVCLCISLPKQQNYFFYGCLVIVLSRMVGRPFIGVPIEIARRWSNSSWRRGRTRTPKTMWVLSKKYWKWLISRTMGCCKLLLRPSWPCWCYLHNVVDHDNWFTMKPPKLMKKV